MSTTNNKQRPVNRHLFDALAARNKSPKLEVVGSERVDQLKKNPQELHQYPPTQPALHLASRQCPCHPSVGQNPKEWWSVTVIHRIRGPEDVQLDPNDDQWQAYREAERQRGHR